MQTLKNAQQHARNIKDKRFAVMPCDYCKEEIMFTIDECDVELYEPVRKTGDVYDIVDNRFLRRERVDTVSSDSNKDIITVRCPNCGHIHHISREEYNKLRKVKWDGVDHMIFEMSEKESQAAREFMEEHAKSCVDKMKRPLALSEYYTIHITPTGLGDIFAIECNACKATKNITDFDTW